MQSPAAPSRVRLRRAEQVERNRRLLLDSALEVFRRDGYAGATLEAIAENAGFSKGVVYSQFASKADLFLTLLEAQIERRVQVQLEDARRLVPTLGAEQYLRHVFAESRRDPLWQLAVLEFRVLAARDPALNERYRRAHRRTLEGIEQVLATVVQPAGLAPGLPLEAVAVASLVIDAGGCLEDAATPGSFGADAAAATCIRLLGVPSASRPRRRRQ